MTNVLYIKLILYFHFHIHESSNIKSLIYKKMRKEFKHVIIIQKIQYMSRSVQR